MWFFFLLSLTCVQDSDCVLRLVNCCSCNQGGKLQAVHKNSPKPDCSKRICPQVISQDKSCEAKNAVCKNKKCHLDWPSMTPKYLYKILSLQDWAKSKTSKTLILPTMDSQFIHLATQDQLKKIIAKYWSKGPKYIVLKINTAQLTGKLVLESNPGGKTKYYHLYQGSIPTAAAKPL